MTIHAVESRLGAIRVLVVDDHPIVRAGMRALLEAQPAISVAGEAADGAELVEAYARLLPDVVMLDLRMPGMEGLPALENLLREFPDARVLIVTTYDGEEDIFRALRAGARGYVLKDARYEQIVEAVERVHSGAGFVSAAAAGRLAERAAGPTLTRREVEVLRIASEGLRNREIAAQLGCGESTVKAHLKSIFAKLDALTRAEAIATARRRGLVR